jgi:hypothetical protein
VSEAEAKEGWCVAEDGGALEVDEGEGWVVRERSIGGAKSGSERPWSWRAL